jgi:hypothetical protein
MPYKDFTINRDAFVVDTGGVGGGAGLGWTLNIGLSGGNVFRAYLKFNLDFANMTDIVSAELRVKTASEVGWTYPSSPRVHCRRADKNWDQGSYGNKGADKITYSSTNAINWGNQPGSTGTTGPDTTVSGGTNVVVAIPCTATVKEWFPVAKGGGGKANYGMRVSAADEANSAQRLEVWSATSGKYDPVLRVYYENNIPPAAPTDLIPADPDHPVLISPTGTTGTFTGRFIDPDIGDTLDAVHFQLHDVASTDAVPILLAEATYTKDVPAGATLTNNTFSIPRTGMVLARQYRWCARTRDSGGPTSGTPTWGPFSSLDNGLFRAVAQLNAPSGLSVDIDSATPFFYGNISGADSAAYITAVDFEVLTAPTSGSATPKWVTTPPGSPLPVGIDVGGALKKYQIQYSGDGLSPGLRYQYRVRVRDQYNQWSPFSAFQLWTYLLPTGPGTMTPKNNTLVSATPLFTIGNPVAFTARQLEVSASEGGGTPVYTNAATVASTLSTTHTPAAGVLQPGTPYWWRAAILLTGTSDYGPWSDWLPFRTNSPPLKATIVSPGSRQASTAQPIGVRRPLYTAQYDDPQLASDSDYPKKRIISIKRTSDNVVLETNTLNSPPYNVPMTYQGTVDLALETAYYQEWTFEDQLNASSGVSDKFYFRHSTPPVLTFAGPATPLTDPTPILSWSATYSGGRSQVAYRVVTTQWINGIQTVVGDTGFVVSKATTYQTPPGLLINGLGTNYAVSVKDQDGNISTVSRTVVAAFTAPATPTGFTATPSISDSSIDLLWTDIAGIDWWVIRRSSEGVESVIVGYAFPGEPNFRDFGAPLGVSSEYELTAYNGWAESTIAATASAVLETTTPGSSVVNTEDFAIEFTQVTDIPSEFSPIQEIIQPIGRPNPIVEALATGTESGTITVRVSPDERWQVQAMRNLAGAVETKIWVKDRYGTTFRVALGNVRRAPAPDGIVELQATWVKVGD